MSLSFYDDEAYQQNQQLQTMLEEFIKGYEILKLRIGKLRQSSIELDQVVSTFADSLLYFKRDTHERKRMLQEIAKVIEWSNSDIKRLQYEAKKAPKQKEVELLGNYCGLSFRLCYREAEPTEKYPQRTGRELE